MEIHMVENRQKGIAKAYRNDKKDVDTTGRCRCWCWCVVSKASWEKDRRRWHRTDKPHHTKNGIKTKWRLFWLITLSFLFWWELQSATGSRTIWYAEESVVSWAPRLLGQRRCSHVSIRECKNTNWACLIFQATEDYSLLLWTQMMSRPMRHRLPFIKDWTLLNIFLRQWSRSRTYHFDWCVNNSTMLIYRTRKWFTQSILLQPTEKLSEPII